MNGLQSYSHISTHTSIYLGVLLSHMQEFIGRVNHTPTLFAVFLQIIHLQLHVEFPFAEIVLNSIWK